MNIEDLKNEFDTTRAAERERVRALVLAMPPLEAGCADALPMVAAGYHCCDAHREIGRRRKEALDALAAYAGKATIASVMTSDLGRDVALALAGDDARMCAYINAHYGVME